MINSDKMLVFGERVRNSIIEQACNYVREIITELENIRNNTASNEMDNQYNNSFDQDID